MKYLIGFVISFVVLALFMIGILKIWGIELISNLDLTRGLLSLVALSFASMLLTIIVSFFFVNNSKDYNPNRGNIAHPRNEK